jgi:DNA-binding response OmpR family regulator
MGQNGGRKNMSKLILIIDDEANILEVTSGILAVSGYEVMTASNYEDAFNLMRDKPPDLILLDVMMPDRDGYEVCNELKSDKRTRDIPIILFTGKPDQKERIKTNAKFLAADDCILKPFDPKVLLEKIKRLIR